MLENFNRRSFLGLSVTAAITRSVTHQWLTPTRKSTTAVTASDQFPKHDTALVLEMVSVSHGNPTRVRELIAKQPALAKTSWDWGFGDWETPIDAASHVGNREIAEVLLKSGARPTIFSAAMMGQLSVVKAFVEATPGVQRILGPHSITLLAHAKAGGAPAQTVRDYLESLGDADPVPAFVPLTEAERAGYLGSYTFGPGDQQLVIGVTGENMFVERVGVAKRTIRYVGNHEFRPSGGEFVRLRFVVANGKASSVSVFAPELLAEATRV
ncbi:MAG: hypothetical protein ABI852_19300 [Gemmatimonadaceae bacterium]